LSVSVQVSGDQVNFSGGSGDNLYLQVNSGGTLQYATTSGGTYQNVTNSQGNYQFDASTQVIFDHLTPLGHGGTASVGTLYLENMGTGGSSYSTDGSIDVQGNLTNSGQGIALSANVAVATGSAAGSSSPVTISTSSTTGSAGAISFSSPSITIGNSDQVLATGAPSSQAGNITFTADNTVRDIGLAFWNFLETITAQVQTHNAGITIGTSANIKGGAISATATAGDNEAGLTHHFSLGFLGFLWKIQNIHMM